MTKILSIRNASADLPTFKDVKQWHDSHMHPNILDLDDQMVYENVYHSGKWAGIFQCVDEESLVTMGDGSYKLIKDIYVGDYVLAFDESLQQLITSVVDVVYDQGVKECIELKFNDGKKLICTTDHLLLTKNRGWVAAIELSEDDDLVEI